MNNNKTNPNIQVNSENFVGRLAAFQDEYTAFANDSSLPVSERLARCRQLKDANPDLAPYLNERPAAEAPANDNTSARLFIAGLDDVLRAMPNHIARSSLFAPVARGRRQFHRETPLVARADAVMTYTGEQLDEADADLCLQLIFEARAVPLGQSVKLNRAALLRAMGRSTGKHDYEWLHRRMKALTAATLFLEAKRPDGSTKYQIGSTESFRIVEKFRYDETTETYTFTLDPRWQTMFGNREYALLDWNKRLQIGRGQDMAKALQRLIATSSDAEQRYSLDWLKAKMQYASPMRKFRPALVAAINELERLGIVAAGQIEQSTKGKEQLLLLLPTPR